MSGRISIPVLRQPLSAGKTTHVDIQRQTQSAGAQSAQALNVFPLQPGKLVTGLVFGSGTPTTVVHGLGRVPKGFWVLNERNYVSGTVSRVQVISAGDPPLTLAIVLHGQGVYTADCWVF